MKNIKDLLNIKYYRLEFNEGQQAFHLNSTGQDAKCKGWEIIYDGIDKYQTVLFQCFLDRNKPKKLTTEYVIKSMREWLQFCHNIDMEGFTIGLLCN